MTRAGYAALYGPTTGDRVRLGDTALVVEVERDLTHYGDEITFGGGKVIRDGMGQHPTATRDEGVLDTVITNALILDHSGIYKADVGLRDGRIAGIGKAGNPLVMDGVSEGMIVGASTEVIAGERHILTERRLRDDPTTLETLAAEYGVSRERVRQIEVRAFEKLQKAMQAAAIEQNLVNA